MNKFLAPIKKYPRARLFVLLLFVCYSLVNIPAFLEEIRRVRNYKRVLDHSIPGYQFRGLEKFTQNIEYISYFSDVNIQDPKAYKLFTQAQLVLTPSILDPSNMTHKYVLFVCRNKKVPLIWMKKWNMIPIARSEQDIILAVRQ